MGDIIITILLFSEISCICNIDFIIIFNPLVHHGGVGI